MAETLTPEHYGDALAANLMNYVQPQIEGGNKTLTMSFTDALTEVNPVLAPNVTEGLKYKETAPAAVNALVANTSPDQRLSLLNTLAPYTTTADHYAWRNPAVEYDVSLMNRDVIAELARQQPDTGAVAAGLLQRGELATADSMRYLADEGVTESGRALALHDRMKTAFQHLDKSFVQAQRDGNTFMAVVSSPYVDTPLMHAVGEVDQAGVWRPQMNGFGLSTPARQQLMEVFDRPEMQEQMAAQGIAAMVPVFSSMAPPNTAARPPTRQQIQQETPPWEAIEQDPQFQALTPVEQQAMKRAYFDDHVATTPPAQAAIQQQPHIYEPFADSFVGPPVPMGPPAPAGVGLSISQAMEQQLQDIPDNVFTKPAKVLAGDVAHVAELTAAAVKGATEGYLPAGMSGALTQAAGDHGTLSMIARATADVAVGSKIPFLGTGLGAGALEASRKIIDPAQRGLPIFDNAANLAKQSLPFGVGGEPTSVAAAAATTALSTGLIALGLPPVAGAAMKQFAFQSEKIMGPLAAKTVMPATAAATQVASAGLARAREALGPVGAKIAAATAPIRERVAQEFAPQGLNAAQVVHNVMSSGSWAGMTQSQLEQAAKEANMPVNAYIARHLVTTAPEISVVKEGQTMVTFKNGTIMKASEFPKDLAERIEKIRLDPSYVTQRIDEPILRDVKAVTGTQVGINRLLAANGMGHFKVQGSEAAKGVRIRPVGDEWRVYATGEATQRFASKELAHKYVNDLPLTAARAEDSVLMGIYAEGHNPHYLMATITNPDRWVGEVPPVAQYPSLAATMLHYVAIPKSEMLALEQKTGTPLYSEMWVPLEAQKLKQQAFAGPWNAELDAILGTKTVRKAVAGGTTKWTQDQLEGYTHLMQVRPNTQAWENIITQHKLDPTTGGLLRDWFTRLAPHFGLDGDEFLTKVLPVVQEKGPADAFQSKFLPKSAHFFAEDMELGTYPIAMKGLDIYTTAKGFINQGSFKQIVGPTWTRVYNMLNDPKNPISQEAGQAADHYLRALRGYGSNFDEMFLKASGRWAQNVFRRTGEIAQGDAEQVGRDLWATMYAANAKGFFGWRPASVTRQMMQTALTTYPRYGEVATFNGMRKSLNKDNWKILEQARVLNPEFTATEGIGAGRATSWINAADNQQRAIAAFAQEYGYDKYVPQYVAKQLSWEQAVKKMGMAQMHPLQQAQVRAKIDSGNTYGGKLIAMFHAAQDTQFPYSPQNRIPLFAGVGGRLFGQFGVFSSNYAEYLRQGMTRGDWHDRGAWLSRWIASNYFMKEAFRGVFGADASNWLFVAPVGFKGGSLFNDLVNQPMNAAFGSERDRSLAIPKLAAAPLHYVPQSSMVQDIIKTGLAKNPQAAISSLLTGMPQVQAPKRPPRFGDKQR